MTAIAPTFSDSCVLRDKAGAALTAEAFRDLASVEALWRKLEAGHDSFATPYQRFDWVAAFIGSESSRTGVQPDLRILVVRDAAGHPQAILPTRLTRRHGVAVAGVIGDKHANFHMPLFAARSAASWPPEAFEAALEKAGKLAGIDVFALDHQPRFWNGVPNPLGAYGERCASDAYGLMLGPDSEATLRRAYSGDARKKLRAKERKLVELVGPVTCLQATSPQGVTNFLAAFHAQKTARFAEQGIPNPYADPGIRDCLAQAAGVGGDPAGSSPAIEVHALVATATNRILATFIGAVDRDRFSGMCNSFDSDPEISRFSPGDLLLYHLIGRQTAAGRKAFDLGVGEARYKANICDETVELVETIIPVTLKGGFYRVAASGIARLKRRIKHSPALWELMQRIRKLRSARLTQANH